MLLLGAIWGDTLGDKLVFLSFLLVIILTPWAFGETTRKSNFVCN